MLCFFAEKRRNPLFFGVALGARFPPENTPNGRNARATHVWLSSFPKTNHFRTSHCFPLCPGTAVGVFFWPPFARWMIDLFDWRGALIIMSAMQLHGLVFGSLLKPRPQMSHSSSINSKDIEMQSRVSHSWPSPNLSSKENLNQSKRRFLEESSSSSLNSNQAHGESPSAGGSSESISQLHMTKYKLSASEEDSLSFHKSHTSEDFTTEHLDSNSSRRGVEPALFWVYLPWLLFFLGNWLIQSCHVLITVLTPVRAHWLGIDNHLAALLISIYGVSSGVSR